MTEPKYNEETCIHAGELRAMGFEIDERIPDCAWVHRSALSNFKVSGDVTENADSKKVAINEHIPGNHRAFSLG
jgi:hypothetical protein